MVGKGNKKNTKNPMARKMLCAAEPFFFFKILPCLAPFAIKICSISVCFSYYYSYMWFIMRMSNSGQEGGGKQNKRIDYKLKMHIVAPVRKKQTYSPRNT